MKSEGITKLGIIAGAGYLPRHVYDNCLKKKIDCLVIGLNKETDFDLFGNIPVEKFDIHRISKIVKFMRLHGVTHVTLAGKVRRADISRLLLDIKGAKLFAMIVANGLGDNAILKTIINFIESEGFKLIAPEKIALDIVVQKGAMTKTKPSSTAEEDIKQGIKILKGISTFDIGQSLVIQNGLVLGIEAAEGTDELIKRCGEIRQEGEPPILVKVCKTHQDKRVDLPCIGPDTIVNAHNFGIRGIAAEAGSSLILEQEKTLKLANEYKIFIVGV
jgi:hypothetical protein